MQEVRIFEQNISIGWCGFAKEIILSPKNEKITVTVTASAKYLPN